ncbi:MAG TPA: hypothetical protein PK131_01590 [Candidatus Woesebacteria bacterium]|nr:hypothetical protein [Candidatus Woesebacteria bacterium]
MKKYSLILIGGVLGVSFFLNLPKRFQVESIPSTNVKDTLSSSQLSYFARVGTGTTAGDSIVRINTAANPSRTTNNLFEGDVVCIGNSGTPGCTQYTVQDIGNTAYFALATTLAPANAFITNYIVATRSAQHVVNFTPQTSVVGGKWQFLIRATSGAAEQASDGMPDQNGFDIGSNVGAQTTGPGARLRPQDVICPFGIGTSATGIGSTVGIVAANGTTYYYHTITCSLDAGAGNPIGVQASMIIGGVSVTNSTQLINPSPNHTVANEGVADLYNFFIRHLTSGDVVIDGDTARGQLAVVESVRVTATVDPTISFIIDNVGVTNVGTSVCAGATIGANAAAVTATQVPFGSLKLQEFNDLAQRVSATTNAASGYAVTVYESDVLTMVGGSITIPDTTCDSATVCTTASENTWASATQTPSKFGYSLTAVPGFTPNTMTFTTGTTNKYRPFPIGAANAVRIFNNPSTPTAWERSYVCYRLTVTNVQPAGNYENRLVYTATATF